MPVEEVEDVSTSSESVELLHQIQQLIIDGNPPRDQAFCIAAEFVVWVLLSAHTDGETAKAQAWAMFPALLANIDANAPGMIARKRLIEELQQEGAPKWVN